MSRTAARTLHDTIRTDLLTRIIRKQWPPGFQLPFETQLAESFGVSRMTMNKVLTELAREGYLVRRKKKGTFVAQPRAQSAVMEIADIEQEVAATGKTHGWSLLRREIRAGDDLQPALFGQETARIKGDVLYLQGLHMAGDDPFCLETRVISPVAVPQALDREFTDTAPGSWLFQTIPWSTARHRIRAINAAPDQARLLDVPVAAACLEVVRRTRLEAQWVTFVRLIYPGDAHQLVAEFEPRPNPADARTAQ